MERIGTERGLAGALYRVALSYADGASADAGAGRPASVVAKFPTSYEPMRRGAVAVGIYEREVRCYRELTSKLPVRVPRCYFSATDPARESFLLLIEDLGAEGFGDDLQGLPIERVGAALEALARLHANPLDGAAVPSWVPSLAHRSELWEQIYDEAWRDAAQLVTNDLPPAAITTAERLRSRNIQVRARLGGEGGGWSTLLHGDARPDNIRFATDDSEGDLALVDWQNVATGTGAYDVAYLLLTALDPERRRIHEAALLRRYHEALVANGETRIDFDRCFADYRLAMLEPFARMFFLLVRGHAPAGSDRAQAVLRQIVVRAGAAISDLDVGELLEDSA